MNKKLSIWEKIGFSMGELGATLFWQGSMFYLGYFYNVVFGLPAAIAGFILFWPRVLDALVDPVVGAISDRTNTRWGKFRPFLLFTSLPFAIFMLLVFYTPETTVTGKTIYAFITYVIVMILYSVIMIPYNALGGVITNDHHERTSLQSYRFMTVFIGGVIVRGFTDPLANFFGGGFDPVTRMPHDPQNGYFMTVVVFSIIAFIGFIITFLSTKERVLPQTNQHSNIKQDLKLLVKNKPWVVLFIVSTLNLIYVGVWSGVTKYFFQYYVTVKDLDIFGWKYDFMSAFNTSSSIIIALVLMTPITLWLGKKIGKKNLLIAGFAMVTISIIGFYFCGPEDKKLIMFLQVLQSLGAAPTMPIIWSMYADAADFGEWKTKVRMTGLVFSAVVLGQKVGIALGSAVPLFVLGLFNFDKDAITQPDVITQTIRICMSILPGTIALLTLAGCIFYPISNKKMDEIQLELETRRNTEK